MATVTLDTMTELDLTLAMHSQASFETSKTLESRSVSFIPASHVATYGYGLYVDRDFVFKVTVGQGASAHIVVCEFVQTAGEHCVVKIAKQRGGSEAKTVERIEHERATLSYFNAVAPGVAVRCLGTYHVQETAFDSGNGLPRISLPKGIVLEYFPQSDFFGILDLLQNTQGKSLNPAVARWYIMDVLFRLSAIHQAGYYHGDVKAENLLLTAEGRIVFGDFGDANIDDVSKWTLVGFGTLGCQAPEVCYGDEEATPGPRRPSDIWSVGVLLYHMLFASNPFEDEDEDVAHSIICDFFEEELWPTIVNSDPYRNDRAEALRFLQRLLVFEPGNRIRCEEVSSHAWLRCHWEDVVYNRREAPLVFRDGQWCVGRTWEGVIFSQVIE